MTEQTFRSPNFFEREIDLSAPVLNAPSGTPGGVIGTANRGPAFVPVTVGNFNDFIEKFGNLDPKRFGPYAVNEFLKHKTSLTYLRVLGAGSNSTDGHITDTQTKGTVVGAGMRLSGTVGANGRHTGIVQFLVAQHEATTGEAYVGPLSDNDSIANAGSAPFVRGMFMTPQGARVMVMSSSTEVFSDSMDDVADADASGKFKLIISSSLANDFANSENKPGLRILNVSLDPASDDYYAKVMNTDPDRFEQEQHLLYADFPVEVQLASASVGQSVAILSGSAATSTSSGDASMPMRIAFGSYNTRFRSPATPWFISQPFGATEHDLFKFEALDDGEFANKLYKIAVADLKASLDPTNPYGTFTVQIRNWNDNDSSPSILEQFSNCSLNPLASNYVAKVIGDRKVYFDFDATVETEKRLITQGKYPNVSKFVRIVMSDATENSMVPANSLPFGFRGLELPKTNPLNVTDASLGANTRLAGSGTLGNLTNSILPPVPFRTKVTRGDVATAPEWFGQPGDKETATSQYYWGVKFESTFDPQNSNITTEKNKLLESYTKFMGISKLDVTLTGSALDTLNNNKFSLSKVAFAATDLTELTGSVAQQMRTATYIRNGKCDPSDYRIEDSVLDDKRLTMASLLTQLSGSEFNKYSPYAKFVTIMQGGWDGVNILDRDDRRMNDKASSFDGHAAASYLSTGFNENFAGTGQSNSAVMSYMKAVDIMTDPLSVGINVLAMPGIRDEYITGHTMNKVRENGLSYYVMDVPAFDDNDIRLYDDSAARPNVDNTVKRFDGRTLDNNYTGVYFPDVVIEDAFNRRKVKVPASIAAMGALAFNDRIAYPWFAPAGFNRAALDFVSNVGVRLNVSDRDALYDSRINPIATFPRLGYVIYGQKTLQVSKSALDRVNVRRLLLEVKRIVIGIAQRLVFEQNTPEVRNRFVTDATLQLGLIQAAAGVEAFQVVMNETNNTADDVNNNKLNGRVVVVPTRVIEYIAVDFIITNSGIQFV
jgi:hypothetical protein